jgi:tetratricopeptide (TPR) repeat protein
MARRFLFGPVNPDSAEHPSCRPPAGEDWFTFGLDLAASWEQVCALLPPAWKPDGIILHLPYASIPAFAWTAPVPLIGWAGDWHLQWHTYRQLLPHCDFVLSDAAGAEALARHGFTHVHPACLSEPSSTAHWDSIAGLLEEHWDQIEQRSRQRLPWDKTDYLLARCRQALGGTHRADWGLVQDLALAVQQQPRAELYNALGLTVARAGMGDSSIPRSVAATAGEYFRRALDVDSTDVLAALNLAEALVSTGDMAQVAVEARRALAVLEQERAWGESEPPPVWLGGGHFPPALDLFRVEWESAAWKYAGQPQREVQAKRCLIRWRLHSLLAEAGGDLVHYHEAALARPDLPTTQAALGCALARAGRFTEAAPHLRRAVAEQPFDRAAARALFAVLGEIGDQAGQRRLADDHRLRHRSAPDRLPAEPWFMEEVPLPAETRANSVGPVTALPRPRVSLCMIVKNEEANLPACLDSVAELVDEIIVVDTGSTDQTRDVALRYHARVVDFPWVDSFAAARNEGLRHATGAWIFWLDADDRLDADNRDRLRACFAKLADEQAAYVMKCLCLPSADGAGATIVDHVRLFRNHPEIRWRYRVHEQILPAVRRQGGEVRWTDVVIHHTGYQDAAVRAVKLQRDLRLLTLENADHPDEPFTLFNLGSVSQELGQPAAAVPLLRRSLELSHPNDSIVRKLYALLARCHRQLGQPAEALAACRAGLGHYPEDAELLFLEGVLLRQQGNRAGAEAVWQRLLGTRERSHFASVDAGLRSHKVRQNLAALFQEEGRYAEAEVQWRALLADQPDFLPAWLGLAELYLGQERWPEFEEVLGRLEPQWPGEAAVLRARRHLAGQDFAAARQLLAAAIATAPRAVWPRVILSHALLQEGRDGAAAEQALRDILALDPRHAEAQRNLAVLRQQQASEPHDRGPAALPS